ncbi:MAG: cardiolipin synthase [Halioglobus sp.]
MLTLANALSVLRILLAAPTAWAVTQGWWGLASLLLAVAIISDLFDGPVARKRGQDSAAGGLLDHSCDALYVVSAFAALSSLSMVPVLLPILVVFAFVQYVLDSNALKGKTLRTNQLGRYNGIAYYALLVIAFAAALLAPVATLQPLLNILGWILIVSTLLSMSDRFWTLFNQGPQQ